MTPPMHIPTGEREIRATYGDIWLTKTPTGAYKIIAPPKWEARNMVLVRDLPGFGPRPLYVHKLAEPWLRKAMAAAAANYPEYKIRSLGCFNPRPKRNGSTSWSLHSWGVAVDINADANPYRVVPEGGTMVCDMPIGFVECFESNGWRWGGRWRPKADPMHFQLAYAY